MRRRIPAPDELAQRIAELAERAAPWLWRHLHPDPEEDPPPPNHSEVVRAASDLQLHYERGRISSADAAAELRRLEPRVAKAVAAYERYTAEAGHRPPDGSFSLS